MDTGEWLDRWLATKQTTPKTLEKYAHAVQVLKESLVATEIEEITVEMVEKVTSGDQSLRSVLSMTLAQAVKANLVKTNAAAVKREQRRPQEGSLYYRANRRAWVAQVTLHEGGKRITKTRLIKVDRKTKNPPETAIRALEELRMLKSGGSLANKISTVGELMTAWLASLRIKDEDHAEGLATATFGQYEKLSRLHIVPHLGQIKLNDLKKFQVDNWLKNLEATTYERGGKTLGYSANTIRLCRMAFGIALKWGIAEGVVARNAARESRKPGGRIRAKKYAMTEDEVKRLIDATKDDSLGPLWALMVTTGLRKGEALGLRWQDYDGEAITVTSQLKFDSGRITRGELKTDKSKRRLRLPKFLIAALDNHKLVQIETASRDGREPPELIFTTRNGSYLRPDNLRERFHSVCKRAGIEPHSDGRPWTVHELRHTAASQLLNDRVPMQIVSRTLGHSSITITLDVYAHLSDQDSDLVADSMDKRYGQN
ncbi:MAG: tyrosine-type recombinase/integrase [Actinomycetota bacterium]|jgi:integrase|nr:tyrosine-type recombinase/integrase [Actinomycetota bacterium]